MAKRKPSARDASALRFDVGQRETAQMLRGAPYPSRNAGANLDVNGNGVINAQDVTLTRNRQFTALPSARNRHCRRHFRRSGSTRATCRSCTT